MVMASARKKLPVTPVTAISGRKTTTGVIVEPTRGRVISAERLAYRLHACLAGVAMQHDVFDHHDGVVDHQADGGRQSAERHQVEALADDLQERRTSPQR